MLQSYYLLQDIESVRDMVKNNGVIYLIQDGFNKMNNFEPVILIDASNLIYRMYYTHISLSNSKGVMTGAIYGFFDMIINYANKLKINNLVLAWETPSE